MTSRPVRSDNAIDEIAFIVLLSKDVDNLTLQNLEGIHDQFVGELPQVERINAVKVAFEANSPTSVTPELSGIQFSKVSDKSSERLSFSLRVDGKSIVVACSEYTSWDEVWPKALRLISNVLAVVDIKNNPVQEVVYQCLDKFLTKLGDSDNYDIAAVFDVSSKYLTQKVVSDNVSSWHIHQGWFSQNVDERARALNNLNIGSVHISAEEIEVQINHIIKIRKADTIPVTSIDEMLDNDDGYLDLAINQAHNGNKSVIRDILNTKMLKAIGLEQ